MTQINIYQLHILIHGMHGQSQHVMPFFYQQNAKKKERKKDF